MNARYLAGSRSDACRPEFGNISVQGIVDITSYSYLNLKIIQHFTVGPVELRPRQTILKVIQQLNTASHHRKDAFLFWNASLC